MATKFRIESRKDIDSDKHYFIVQSKAWLFGWETETWDDPWVHHVIEFSSIDEAKKYILEQVLVPRLEGMNG